MVNLIGATDYSTLDNTDDALAAMMARLERLLEEGPLTQDDVVEITAIFNNVSYVFLYLESNEVHINYNRVLPWRRRFYANPELDRRLVDSLDSIVCADAEVEQSRRDFLAHLRRRRTPSAAEDELSELAARQKSVLASVEQDTRELLNRLGVDGRGRPSAVFYNLVSRTADASTRQKLTRAWDRARDRRLPDLLDLVDKMVRVRRVDARADGFDSPLARTLTRSRVDEPVAGAFLHRFLELALEDASALCADMSTELDTNASLAADFGHFIRRLVGPVSVPTFDLDDCLELAFAAARRSFGLTFQRIEPVKADVITVDASIGDDLVGRITFDLWDTSTSPRLGNTTRGARNRTEWGDIVQLPAAFVACRFERTGDDARINFQNMHSLFHEFGHAVNHILIRRRLPTQSGLEYLPLERLENLSMWFEKWVFHPDLARQFGMAGDAAAGVAVAQRVKLLEYRRTHVDRAVTALLDFELHRRGDEGLGSIFADLVDQWPVSDYCDLGDFPQYFSWPMFQANPGANFAYLWGAADSAGKFAPFLSKPVGAADASEEELHASFASCFDFALPSEQPDPVVVFDFYRGWPVPA